VEPNSLSVWLSKADLTFRVATVADVFAVHFPAQDDIDLARIFGTLSGDDVDKFDLCAWHPGPDDVPVLDGCAQHVVGRKRALLQTTDDHACLVLDPIEATFSGPFEPLRLSDVVHFHPGHEADERPAPATTRADETRRG
jgi:flavin reductase (DIM6/NTAB) family NADH-FMN oxidoreductase RutF